MTDNNFLQVIILVLMKILFSQFIQKNRITNVQVFIQFHFYERSKLRIFYYERIFKTNKIFISNMY